MKLVREDFFFKRAITEENSMSGKGGGTSCTSPRNSPIRKLKGYYVLSGEGVALGEKKKVLKIPKRGRKRKPMLTEGVSSYKKSNGREPNGKGPYE